MKKIKWARRLQGLLTLPADKSISHRAAMFAALSDEQSHITNFSSAADPHTTLKVLRQLGVSVQQKEDELFIEGVGRNGLKTPGKALDCQNSGTTMRLLSGILAGAAVKCTLTGDASLSKRPMKRIIDPLRLMGVEITALDDHYAPLKIQRRAPLKPIVFELPIASAQLKSCVLLAGLFGNEPTTVIETTPSRDHTERLLQLAVENKKGARHITADSQCVIPPQSYRIPGDFSAAAYWLVAASVHPEASIKLPGVGLNPTRTGALQILQQMGANITIENERKEGFEPVADITVQSSTLKPVDIGSGMVPNCIDELPVLMAAMLFAEGTSTIRGAEELRHKETDRLAAMAEVLQTAGASFKEKEDGIVINGDPDFIPETGTFKSFGDHRIAMSAAVLTLQAGGKSEIIDGECTHISYPGFWDDLEQLTMIN